MNRIKRVIICVLFLVVYCFSINTFLVSATSYVSKNDKIGIEKLLADTDAVNGKCNKIKISRYEDGKYKDEEISLVKFIDNQTLTNLERQPDGSFKENNTTINDYIGNGFFAMEADYRFVDYVPEDDKRIILDNVRNNFNNKSYGISEEAKQMFYNEIRELYGDDIQYMQGEIINNVQPNMFLAYELFYPFRGNVGTALGCICCILIVSLIFSVVLDYLYIQVPEFRERTFQDTQKRGRFSFMRNRSKIDRPWFVSYEAARASKESIESNGTRNGLLLYMKYRVITWIVIAACLTYLLTGMFMDIVNGVWNVTPKIFDVATWGA